MISTVIFDLDGTIFDSEAVLVKIFREVFFKYDLIPEYEIDLKRFIGPQFGDVLNQLGADEELHLDIRMELDSLLLSLAAEHRIFDGMKSVVEEVSRNYETFVATSKPLLQANNLLEQFGMKEYFTDVYGENIYAPVSKSELVKQIKLNRKSLGSLVMIGDSESDVIAASNNNIYSIFVTWGYGALNLASGFKPSEIVKLPSQLLQKIEVLK